MVSLTNGGDYDLLVEVCCAGSNTMQFYAGFQVSGASYTLTAQAEVAKLGLDFTSSNSGKRDIGMNFTTYNDMDETTRESCDIVRYYGDNDAPVINAQTGGWWFGSCGNNLNGEFVATSGSAKCHLDESFPQGTTGVEMRTTTGMYAISGDMRSFDGISYDRVRMAIYKTGKIPIATSSFCN